MVMLSHFWHFTLVDAHHRHAKIADLAVALPEGDYPPVTHLCFYAQNKQLLALPWDAVQSIDWRVRHITIADLAAGLEVPLESLTRPVLLSQDILDALIIDLQNRRVLHDAPCRRSHARAARRS
jgi:hypothetical protein